MADEIAGSPEWQEAESELERELLIALPPKAPPMLPFGRMLWHALIRERLARKRVERAAAALLDELAQTGPAFDPSMRKLRIEQLRAALEGKEGQ